MGNLKIFQLSWRIWIYNGEGVRGEGKGVVIALASGVGMRTGEVWEGLGKGKLGKLVSVKTVGLLLAI